MGTAPVQGPLWGSRARDWAEIQEGMLRPAYLAVFDALGVGPGTRSLDVGCGTGMAAQLEAARGVLVSGLDASSASIEIARERTPAGDFRVGEMEELPFADHAFDAVTSFNAFQYAADPVAALRQAARVSASGGRVAMVVWGEPHITEHAATLAALGPLMPPPPPGAPGPFALSAPGKVEALMEQAGLQPAAGSQRLRGLSFRVSRRRDRLAWDLLRGAIRCGDAAFWRRGREARRLGLTRPLRDACGRLPAEQQVPLRDRRRWHGACRPKRKGS
jgi:SAM-dependent methyltransferase